MDAVSVGLAAWLLHSASASVPVPHWVVLLVAVPTLWLAIGGAVMVLDRLLAGID